MAQDGGGDAGVAAAAGAAGAQAPVDGRGRRLYTAQEAAEVLGVTPPRVRQRAVEGTLPTVIAATGKGGRRSYRFPADEVDALASAERSAGAPRPRRASPAPARDDASDLELALAQGRVRDLEAELVEARHRLELEAARFRLDLVQERARRDAELVRARAELEHHKARREELEAANAELARARAESERQLGEARAGVEHHRARERELERSLAQRTRALLGQLDTQRAQLAHLLDDPEG